MRTTPLQCLPDRLRAIGPSCVDGDVEIGPMNRMKRIDMLFRRNPASSPARSKPTVGRTHCNRVPSLRSPSPAPRPGAGFLRCETSAKPHSHIHHTVCCYSLHELISHPFQCLPTLHDGGGVDETFQILHHIPPLCIAMKLGRKLPWITGRQADNAASICQRCAQLRCRFGRRAHQASFRTRRCFVRWRARRK